MQTLYCALIMMLMTMKVSCRDVEWKAHLNGKRKPFHMSMDSMNGTNGRYRMIVSSFGLIFFLLALLNLSIFRNSLNGVVLCDVTISQFPFDSMSKMYTPNVSPNVSFFFFFLPFLFKSFPFFFDNKKKNDFVHLKKREVKKNQQNGFKFKWWWLYFHCWSDKHYRNTK